MTSTARERIVAALVVVAAALLLLPGLGNLDLWAPDEPRYAEVADEIVRAQGASRFVVFELNGEAYTQKPPLYYWLAALPGLFEGRVSALDARLPSALAGIAVVGMTYLLGLRLFGSTGAGAWAALILLTTFRFAHVARRAQLDVLLAAFEVLAWLAFAQQQPGHPPRKRNVALFHAALGAAVLTKGPVGLLPFAVVAALLLWERETLRLRDWFPAWGLALSLGPALLWLLCALSLAPAGFFEIAIVDNLFGRFFAGTSHPRPLYYYLFQFPLDFMPWTVLWPLAAVALARNLKTQTAEGSPHGWRFASLWLGVFFVFFSISAGKRGLYLLPAFPAAALLCGAALQRAVAKRRPLPAAPTVGFLLVLGSLAAAGFYLAAGPPLELAPGFVVPGSFCALVGGLSLVAALLGVAWVRREDAARLLMGLAVSWVFAVEAALFAVAYPAFDAEKSPRPIARAANLLAGPEGTIGLYRERALLGGLVYYGRLYGDRPVVWLAEPADVGAFVKQGGRVVVARRRDLAQWPELEEKRSLRHGRRTLGIATPAHGESSAFRN